MYVTALIPSPSSSRLIWLVLVAFALVGAGCVISEDAATDDDASTRGDAADGGLGDDATDGDQGDACVGDACGQGEDAGEGGCLQGEPCLRVEPGVLDFGQVAAGEVMSREVSVSNVGAAPLCITRMEITGSLAFSPEPGQGTRSELALPATPLRLEPSAGDAYVFELLYAPQAQSLDTGALIITHDLDCDLATTSDVRGREVELRANGVEPCLRAAPESLDFGQVAPGEVKEQVVMLENCGDGDLSISDLRIEDASAPGVFTVLTDLISVGVDEDGAARLGPGGTLAARVGFEPGEEGPASGALHVVSDAPSSPWVVPLSGNGAINRCPVAAASARTVNSGAPFEALTVASPLDVLELEGDASSDPDGDSIAQHRWAVIEAPRGFALDFRPASSVPNPTIELVLVGSYVFELTVVDERGLESCEPARVGVRVTSDRAFHAELTWETPADDTVGDNSGPDLDLHLLEPGGAWNDRGGSDCFFANCTTGLSWGVSGSTADDPHLTRDDVDGDGPETLDIREPAWTAGGGAPYSDPYQVGVYYFTGHEAFGTSYATIRLYFDQATEPSVTWPSTPDVGTEGRALETSGGGFGGLGGDFWIAGAIDWDSAGPTVTEVDVVTKGFPAAP